MLLSGAAYRILYLYEYWSSRRPGAHVTAEHFYGSLGLLNRASFILFGVAYSPPFLPLPLRGGRFFCEVFSPVPVVLCSHAGEAGGEGVGFTLLEGLIPADFDRPAAAERFHTDTNFMALCVVFR